MSTWDPNQGPMVDWLLQNPSAWQVPGTHPYVPPPPPAPPGPSYAPPPPGAPPPPAPPGVAGVGGLTPDQLNSQSIILATLHQYGLDSPDLVAWANQAIVNGETADQMKLELYDPSSTPGKVVAARFPEIAQRSAKGLSPITIDAAQQYHDTVTGLFRSSGLPTGFYDFPEEISSLLANDVSPTEIKDRIDKGYTMVAQADPSIRQAFSDFYGANGDAALATYFLDPTKAQPILEKEVAAAQVGGIGSAFGFNTGRSLAEQIANTGISDSAARTDFSHLQQIAPLFNANPGEDSSLTALGAGAQAEFGLGGTGAQDVQRRMDERKAAFQGAGSAQVGTTGAFGLGTERSI